VLTHTFPAFTAQLVANNSLVGWKGQAVRKTELFLHPRTDIDFENL